MLLKAGMWNMDYGIWTMEYGLRYGERGTGNRVRNWDWEWRMRKSK